MDWTFDDVVQELCGEPFLLPRTVDLAALGMALKREGVRKRISWQLQELKSIMLSQNSKISQLQHDVLSSKKAKHEARRGAYVVFIFVLLCPLNNQFIEVIPCVLIYYT
jgi:hypothetical protein